MMIRSLARGATGAALMLAAVTAQAASAQDAAKVADAGPQVHSAISVDRDDEASCSRSRRRLWIEGEGWVVRRITTCR